MLRRTVSGIMLFLLLVSTLTLTFNIQPAKAEWTGTVYIRADGSIDPPDAPIITPDNVTYTLTDNIASNADGIVVEKDSIIIDGAGYAVIGTLTWVSKGIDLTGRGNVTVKSAIIKAFTYGLYLENSQNILISGNSITANNFDGIYLYYSSNNSIYGNKITGNNFDGIDLYYSSNNSIVGNNITANNWYGIWLGSSSNNSISENNFINNGLFVRDSYQNSVENNTVNGRPLVYLEGASHHTVGDAGQVVLVKCEDIRVEGLNLSRTDVGVELIETSNSTLYGNNITANNWCGIYLRRSSNNIIFENNIENNDYGIDLYYSSNHNSIYGNNIENNRDGINLYYSSNNNIIYGNNITANNWHGIYLDLSSNNNIFENNIENNYYGIELWDSSNNSIYGNNIENNRGGIGLLDSSNNSISGNNITANNYLGIWLDSSFNNRFHHNNFINNKYQVRSEDSINTWDDGYPSGGNYWSDYAGVDVKSGPNQDLPGSDGIGDSPYVIDENNADHYPLMVPYGAPPPTTYNLTITATVGGTTDPAPGTYSYTASSSVPVTAIPDVDYEFDYWELDGVNVGSANPYTVLMDKDHTLKAVFSVIPPPLSASISPLSASINVGESLTFTSTVSGGYTPYSYQWCLNDNPVSGATSDSWAFTPTTSGIYYVYLKVTDAEGNVAQSETARITVAAVPVGGYSIPIQVYTKAEPIIPYIAITAILTAIFVEVKRKTKRKH